MPIYFYIILVFAPLLGAIVIRLFEKHLDSYGLSLVSISSVFLSLLFSIFAYYDFVLTNSLVYLRFSPWFKTNLLNVNGGFLFDDTTIIMCSIVSLFSLILQLYLISNDSTGLELSDFLFNVLLATFIILFLSTWRIILF